MQPGSRRSLKRDWRKVNRQAMKFSDGYWQMRPGLAVWHPVEAYDVAESTDA